MILINVCEPLFPLLITFETLNILIKSYTLNCFFVLTLLSKLFKPYKDKQSKS